MAQVKEVYIVANLNFRRVVTAAMFLMVAYTVLRAALVWGALDEYGVNPWIFLALDVATAPPYVWGVGKMIQALRGIDPASMLYVGGGVAIVSFLLPYIYLYTVGYTTMPLSTKIVIGAIILVLFVAGPLREVIKKSQDR